MSVVDDVVVCCPYCMRMVDKLCHDMTVCRRTKRSDPRRDMFAAAALQGLLANPACQLVTNDVIYGSARMHADAIIAELDKEG